MSRGVVRLHRCRAGSARRPGYLFPRVIVASGVDRLRPRSAPSQQCSSAPPCRTTSRSSPGSTTHAVRHGTASFELEPPDQTEMTRRYEALRGRRLSRTWWRRSKARSRAMPMPGPIARARPIAGASRIRSMSPQSPQRRGIGRALIERLIADAEVGRLPADDRGDRGFRPTPARSSCIARRLPDGRHVRQCRLQVRTLARQRLDAARRSGPGATASDA